jgi:hypothetical protein
VRGAGEGHLSVRHADVRRLLSCRATDYKYCLRVGTRVYHPRTLCVHSLRTHLPGYVHVRALLAGNGSAPCFGCDVPCLLHYQLVLFSLRGLATRIPLDLLFELWMRTDVRDSRPRSIYLYTHRTLYSPTRRLFYNKPAIVALFSVGTGVAHPFPRMRVVA